MDELRNTLNLVPSVKVIGFDETEIGWKVTLTIDIEHQLAWRVIQELASLLNDLSVEEKLPSKFWPISPPPYLNGGPDEYLTWVIESFSKEFTPDKCNEWITGRLPDPIDDEEQWVV